MSQSNKSVIVKGPYDVVVENRPIPELQSDDDAVIKVDVAALCGSDLHIYRGHPPQPKYDFVIGHEIVGTVSKVGKNVKSFKPGDKVVVPFTVSCGECYFCQREWTGRCTKGAVFGSLALDGGQAEWARIPLAETSLFHAPSDIPGEHLILMSDIYPTGYFAARNAWNTLNEKERVGAVAAVIGCGPVGLCGISAAKQRFSKVFAIDSVPERLKQAEAHGAIAINLNDDPIKKIQAQTDGRGPDVVLEIVGAPDALQLAIDLVRPAGVVASCGLHTHELKLQGLQLYGKNVRFHFGRCPVRSVFGEALASLAKVSKESNVFDAFIQKRVKIDEAPEYYKLFNERKVGKVVFIM